jgi:RNA polymerase-binding transcription factor DksA
MAIIRKKLLAKLAPGPKAMGLSPGKGKPAPKKPGAAPSAPASKPTGKLAIKPASKPPAKPAPAAAAKPAAVAKTPQPKVPKPPKPAPILNKGALAAKEAAAKRAAEAAKLAAEQAEAHAKRPRKLVPATANAIRPGAAKAPPAKGKAANRPPAEVRPLGVLPPESMAKAKPVIPGARPIAPLARPLAPARPQSANVRPGDSTGLQAKAGAGQAARGAKGEERVSEADLKHFETRLLEERARIMREMGHIENTILKVNPRDSAGEVGGYSFHMADAGTDSMEREISFDIASKEGRLLREIDDALRRIYNGVYGICEASGKPIARARLEALPWARYTIEEQHNMEMKQRAGRLVKEEE